MICPTCNKEIEDGVLVCKYCGQEFAYEEVEEEESEITEVEEATAPKADEDAEEVIVNEKSPKGFSIAAFVCALCGIVTIFSPIGLVLSILALVFNRVYKKKGGEANKLTKAAKVIGIIVLVISAISTLTGLIGGSIFASTRWDELEKFCEKFVDWVGDFFKLFRVFR